jgi:transcriptional regulator with XRE-family HTH domain
MIGKRLKKARELKEMTQQEVADETDIARTTLSKIENDIYEPSIEQLRKLIELYNVNANWLLDVGIKNDDK